MTEWLYCRNGHKNSPNALFCWICGVFIKRWKPKELKKKIDDDEFIISFPYHSPNPAAYLKRWKEFLNRDETK